MPTEEENEELQKTIDIVTGYAQDIVDGKISSNKWVYAAAVRFQDDLTREELKMDWEEAHRIRLFTAKLSLIHEHSGKAFILEPWQMFFAANSMCWKFTADGVYRTRLAILSCGRGAGKTTLMAAMALYSLFDKDGGRVYCIANNIHQADILFDTAKTMCQRLPQDSHDAGYHFNEIYREKADSTFHPLAASEKSLDGLTISFAVCDEAAEYRSSFMTKLMTSQVKRVNSLICITTTPGNTTENIYYEIETNACGVLKKEVVDDSIFIMKFGLDEADALEPIEMEKYTKANPSLPVGQPTLRALEKQWNSMKNTPMGRNEFNRFHACRLTEGNSGFLDMADWETMNPKEFDWNALKGQKAWIGVDLSKSQDMTAVVLAIPISDGRVAIKGHYFFPSENLASRELEMRMPVRQWASEGRLSLSVGREIDYEEVRMCINDLCSTYDVVMVGYDPWNSTYLMNKLQEDGVPLTTYRMNISTVAPGTALWLHYWLGKKLIFPCDPVMRRACAEAACKKDINNNMRIVKSREYAIIDPLVAASIALHISSAKSQSIYEIEGSLLNE